MNLIKMLGLENLHIESFHRSNKFQFAVFWSNQCYKFLKKQFRKKLVDARNNLIDMHLIQSLKINFSKYPATSINSYFYGMILWLYNSSTSPKWLTVEKVNIFDRSHFNCDLIILGSTGIVWKKILSQSIWHVILIQKLASSWCGTLFSMDAILLLTQIVGKDQLVTIVIKNAGQMLMMVVK